MSLARMHREEDIVSVEINLVPLIDVSLVLLIIFMVTATFLKTSGMHLELPAGAGNPAPAPRELVIEVSQTGNFAWGGVGLSEAALAGVLQQEARAHGTAGRVTIRGDRRAAYGQIVTAMSLAQNAGFTHLIVATQPPQKEEFPRAP